uniref:ATP synthase F0 subunit 8 n=1 Tax=Dictyomenia sonderi TaxID=2007178 RepID=UPI0022FD8EC0|nr:ATP synthase F0 subunit 8 [Dictyomenia sonderi]WAX04266.1 ATP synthase F0 subunit 8 [Dictyomenia sonderi]
MPQLDFLIILPQIFWLIICFTLFYFTLSYLFLPFFLKTIKARINFIKNNQLLETQLNQIVFEKQQSLFKNLNTALNKIRSVLFTKLFHLKFKFKEQPYKKTYLIRNKKILTASAHSFLFCNSLLLNSLKFYPLFLNKKS